MINQEELALDVSRPWLVEKSTAGLARGVCRLLQAMDCVALVEFPLSSGRRADILALDRRGAFIIVEIKSGLADFRGDLKWPDYLAHCERFYFAVAANFPVHELPPEAGIILADSYGAECLRDAPVRTMPAGARRKQTLRFLHELPRTACASCMNPSYDAPDCRPCKNRHHKARAGGQNESGN